MPQLRCPWPDCGHTQEVDAAELGRNVVCARCERVVTARPEGFTDRVAAERARGAEARRTLPFEVLLDDVRSLWNVGSIFRSADAAGVRHLHLCGITGAPPRKEISKTALGAEAVIPFTQHPNAAAAAATLRGSGQRLVVLDDGPQSQRYDLAELRGPLCLVLGNEVAGVRPEVRALADQQIYLPMRGIKETLNVAVAFGIAAFEIARQLEAASPD